MSIDSKFSVPLSLTESLAGIYLDNVPNDICELELHFGAAFMNLTWSRDTLLKLRGQNLLNVHFDGPIPTCLSKDAPPMLRWTSRCTSMRTPYTMSLPDPRIEYVPCTYDIDSNVEVRIKSHPNNTIRFFRTKKSGRQVALARCTHIDETRAEVGTFDRPRCFRIKPGPESDD
jgi:hypothetical protein